MAHIGVDTFAVQLLGRWGSATVLTYIRDASVRTAAAQARARHLAKSLGDIKKVAENDGLFDQRFEITPETVSGCQKPLPKSGVPWQRKWLITWRVRVLGVRLHDLLCLLLLLRLLHQALRPQPQQKFKDQIFHVILKLLLLILRRLLLRRPRRSRRWPTRTRASTTWSRSARRRSTQ